MENESKKFAATATVGEKGQIVIPKQIREMFGIKSGDTLLILADESRGIAIPPKTEADAFYERLMGNESGT